MENTPDQLPTMFTHKVGRREAIATGFTALAALFAAGCGQASENPQPKKTITPTVPDATATTEPENPAIYFGIYDPAFSENPNALASVESALGGGFAINHIFQNIADNATFPADFIAQNAAKGRLTMVTIETWDGNASDNTSYTLGSIIRGDHDAIFQSWAQAAKASGVPVFYRPMPEMNMAPVDANAWSESSPLNHQGEYIAAWRHIHDIFQEADATNVTFVWCPNVSYTNSLPIPEFFPGESYVDWIGITGYPFDWVSMYDLYKDDYATITKLHKSAPVMFAEWGPRPGDNPNESESAWISDALLSMQESFPRVRAIVPFNQDNSSYGEYDWRILNPSIRDEVIRLIKQAGFYALASRERMQSIQGTIPAPTLHNLMSYGK